MPSSCATPYPYDNNGWPTRNRRRCLLRTCIPLYTYIPKPVWWFFSSSSSSSTFQLDYKVCLLWNQFSIWSISWENKTHKYETDTTINLKPMRAVKMFKWNKVANYNYNRNINGPFDTDQVFIKEIRQKSLNIVMW